MQNKNVVFELFDVWILYFECHILENIKKKIYKIFALVIIIVYIYLLQKCNKIYKLIVLIKNIINKRLSFWNNSGPSSMDLKVPILFNEKLLDNFWLHVDTKWSFRIIKSVIKAYEPDFQILMSEGH